MFTQSIKLYKFYCHILKSVNIWKKRIHQIDRKWKVAPFCKFYGRSWVSFGLKVNHLAYIAPRWYGSRISADSQQNLLSLKYDTSRRFLLITSLGEQKKEYVTHLASLNTNFENILLGKEWTETKFKDSLLGQEKLSTVTKTILT